MLRANKLFQTFNLLIIFLLAGSIGYAQEKSKKQSSAQSNLIMWEQTNISRKDLFHGPGGKQMLPNLSRITFIKEEKEGHNKKYRIKDGSGRVWVAKITREPQSETAAVRLIWALGYKTEINYLVPSLTIPGKGTFENVRLEARPENVKRLDEWSWKENPFADTKALQGLKIMMVFLSNWDVGDFQNKILEVNGKEHHYIISDLGATFGRLGNNNLPIIYRLGRQISDPDEYLKASLIKEVEDGEVKLAYKGKNRWIFEDISVEDAAWLAGLLSQLRDQQIRDIFRAANYAPDEIETFTRAVKKRIKELNKAAGEKQLAGSPNN